MTEGVFDVLSRTAVMLRRVVDVMFWKVAFVQYMLDIASETIGFIAYFDIVVLEV